MHLIWIAQQKTIDRISTNNNTNNFLINKRLSEILELWKWCEMGQCRPDAQHGVAGDAERCALVRMVVIGYGGSRSSPPSSLGWVRGGSRSPKTDVSASTPSPSVRSFFFFLQSSILFLFLVIFYVRCWYPNGVRVDLIKIVSDRAVMDIEYKLFLDETKNALISRSALILHRDY